MTFEERLRQTRPPFEDTLRGRFTPDEKLESCADQLARQDSRYEIKQLPGAVDTGSIND